MGQGEPAGEDLAKAWCFGDTTFSKSRAAHFAFGPGGLAACFRTLDLRRRSDDWALLRLTIRSERLGRGGATQEGGAPASGISVMVTALTPKARYPPAWYLGQSSASDLVKAGQDAPPSEL
jgi:hypothetical protein